MFTAAKEHAVPTILVVDDSEIDRRVAGQWVEQTMDAHVIFAADGKQAIEQIEQNHPDIVVTDMQMPEMDGLQLLAAIKDDHPLIPVVLITAKGSEDVAAEALRQGATSYVPKKRLSEDLPETLQRILMASREDRGHSRLMHHLTEEQSTFVLTNDLRLIRSLVSHLQQMLRCLPLGDETQRLRVGIALEEALKNAYYHGSFEVGRSIDSPDHWAYSEMVDQRRYELPYRDRRIHVMANISRDEARFIVRDEGPGFDVTGLPAVTEMENADQPVGRGVILMRSIMDEVRYNDTGNEVTLIKRRIPEPIEDESVDD